jgi:uncharacterized protein
MDIEPANDALQPSQPPPLVAAEVVEEPKSPWGLWMTLLLSFLVMAVFFAVQTGVAIVCFVIAIACGQFDPRGNPEFIQQFAECGWVLAATTWACLPFTIGAIYFFVRLRKRWTLREYLGWEPVPFRQACLWLTAVAAFLSASEFCSWWLELSNESNWMKNIGETAGWLPLVWATMLIAAPVFEECFFRGFFFRGLQASLLGSPGAIIVTSIVWAAIHLQYDFYQIVVIFLGGCLIGAARAVTGSCKMAIGMHFLWNLFATLQVYLLG